MMISGKSTLGDLAVQFNHGEFLVVEKSNALVLWVDI